MIDKVFLLKLFHAQIYSVPKYIFIVVVSEDCWNC